MRTVALGVKPRRFFGSCGAAGHHIALLTRIIWLMFGPSRGSRHDCAVLQHPEVFGCVEAQIG